MKNISNEILYQRRRYRTVPAPTVERPEVDRIECDPAVEQQNEVARTGRANSYERILSEIFHASLKKLKPNVSYEIIESIVSDLELICGILDVSYPPNAARTWGFK